MGVSPNQRIKATASLTSPVDPYSTPARNYSFVLAGSPVGVVSDDDRPWLGVNVSATNSTSMSPSNTLKVVDVVPGSPAAGKLQPGDIILSIDRQPIPGDAVTIGPFMVDQLLDFHPGVHISIQIHRQGQDESVNVRLGSVLDPSAQNAMSDDPDQLSIFLL